MGDSFAFGLICLVGGAYAIVPTIVVSFVRTIIFVVVTIAVAVALRPRITTAHLGIATAARMPMITMTTMTSISVKPFFI